MALMWSRLALTATGATRATTAAVPSSSIGPADVTVTSDAGSMRETTLQLPPIDCSHDHEVQSGHLCDEGDHHTGAAHVLWAGSCVSDPMERGRRATTSQEPSTMSTAVITTRTSPTYSTMVAQAAPTGSSPASSTLAAGGSLRVSGVRAPPIRSSSARRNLEVIYDIAVEVIAEVEDGWVDLHRMFRTARHIIMVDEVMEAVELLEELRVVCMSQDDTKFRAVALLEPPRGVAPLARRPQAPS